MPAIVTRTLHGASDKVLRLTNGEALRSMAIGTDWTSLCLGLRFRFRTNYNFGVHGVFAAGLCAGTASGYSGQGHSLGYRTKFAEVRVYGSGTYTHIANMVSFNGNLNCGYGAVFSKSGGVLTDAGEHGYTPWTGSPRLKMGDADGEAPNDYGWLIYFLKGTPWTVGVMVPGNSWAGGETSEDEEHFLTSDLLMAALETGTPEEAFGAVAAGGRAGYWLTGSAEVGAQANDLDSIFLHWNKATNDVEVSEVAAAKWA